MLLGVSRWTVYRSHRLSTARLTSPIAFRASSTDRKVYSDTLLLPKTALPLKHKNPVDAELRYRTRTTSDLYKGQQASDRNEDFVLHDGPPYANGHLHMGHALNKILKDIINRYQVIRGRKVHYVPGWDCHGLPIEQKALQAIGKSHTNMSVAAVRETARATATEAIEIQKKEFKALAIMADWDSPAGVYITMNADFEQRQMRLFQKMVEEGHITYRLRPTYYSPSSRTALAESELKYQDGHKSRSVYVGFDVERGDMSQALGQAYDRAVGKVGQLPLRLAVWTTTPWTLPANAGVNVGAEIVYVLAVTKDSQLLVVAEERVSALADTMWPFEVVGTLTGSELSGTRYTHTFHPPTSKDPRPTVFPSTHVTSQSGTGLVHSAPAHGHDDYIAFAKAGLMPDRLRCPVDDAGCFTDEVVGWAGSEARSLVNKSVLGDGVSAVMDLLRDQGSLFAEEVVEHRYPHDWKTKQPIIVRATPQWFADVESIKPRAMKALDHVEFYPPQSRNRLEAFVTSRSEWCISRQRSWGVPIPALYDATGAPIVDKQTIAHIIAILSDKGTDHWWTGTVEEFTPPHLSGQILTKGTDTLDVWFDSGSSWTLLEGLRHGKPLADVYLEGSDQHRGWFQSSLLTKLGVSKGDTRAPYGSIISHGFVMDEDGQKMSKSAGNGMSPVDVAIGTNGKPGQGADTLRVWAASVDYTRDVSIGPSAIKHAGETLRKIRSATRFLLANSAEAGDVSTAKLGLIDRYILHELSQLEFGAIEAYDAFAFNRVLHHTTTFISSLLSSVYFEAIKDTLYCEDRASPRRQAIVATLQEVSRTIRRIVAPIAPHLAEELYEYSGGTESSVFLDTWSPSRDWRDAALAREVGGLLALRVSVNQRVEEMRAKGDIKAAAEADVYVVADGEVMRVLRESEPDLHLLLGVAKVTLSEVASDDTVETAFGDLGAVHTRVAISTREKCPRCWRHQSSEKDELCRRCSGVTQHQ